MLIYYYNGEFDIILINFERFLLIKIENEQE